MGKENKVFIFCMMLLTVLPTSAQHGDALDDVLQHIPMVSVLILKASGAPDNNSWALTLGTCAATYVVGTGATYGLKHTMHEWRPDNTDHYSFPSGHSMFAFAGATALRHEFGHLSPWVSIGGYGVATFVAVDRVCRDRHYVHDVLAGAAIGALSAELCFFLKNKLFKPEGLDLAFTGTQLAVSYRW